MIFSRLIFWEFFMILVRCLFLLLHVEKSFKNHSVTVWNCLEVCVPSLFFETRQDETGGHFPNCRDRDKTTFVWFCCSGKIREKFGTGQDYSLFGQVSTCTGCYQLPIISLDECAPVKLRLSII